MAKKKKRIWTACDVRRNEDNQMVNITKQLYNETKTLVESNN